MADRDAAPRQVEIKNGEETVAAAEVSRHPGGTARASLHAPSGHVDPDSRASLVDAVVDTPEVRESSRLEATVPLGDSVALDRLRERTEEASTRPAGSTALVDATLPGAAEDQPPAAAEDQPPAAAQDQPPAGQEQPPAAEPPAGGQPPAG
jgi:hypothetical protein